MVARVIILFSLFVGGIAFSPRLFLRERGICKSFECIVEYEIIIHDWIQALTTRFLKKLEILCK